MNTKSTLYAALGIILLAGIIFFFIQRGNANSAVNKNQKQAVFLTNGQVYFGNLSDVNDQYLIIEDVYYLSSKDKIQTGVNLEDQKVPLLKLGGEIHGPEDRIFINRDHVLFYENMKDDSKVNGAITRYQEKKNEKGGTGNKSQEIQGQTPDSTTTQPADQPASGQSDQPQQ